MSSELQVLRDLKSALDSGNELDLLTQFRGMPFLCRAQVVNIAADKIYMKVFGSATVLLNVGDMVRIWSSDLRETAAGRILKFDPRSSALELGEISYKGTALDNRMNVRVEPKTPLEVGITHANLQVSGRMADISMQGMGLLLPLSDATTALKHGAELNLQFTLPTGSINVRGKILNISRATQHLRMSILFDPEMAHKNSVFSYIVDRRSQIESELHNLYEKSL